MAIITSYLLKEKEGLISAPEEWMAKVQELGLEGQQELIAAGQKSPIPFTRMTIEHKRVLEAICPIKEEVKKFGKEAIPMEVLALIGLAIMEKYFEKIEIWYSRIDPDPVVIGNGEYLLAQWGPERISYDAQREKAKALLQTKLKAQAEVAIEDAKKTLGCLDALIERHLAGEYTGIYF
jgi:hypothetical protein